MTVRRTPGQEGWGPANLEWMGKDDNAADGCLPQFDLKDGPERSRPSRR
jgi:hypothetical protein